MFACFACLCTLSVNTHTARRLVRALNPPPPAFVLFPAGLVAAVQAAHTDLKARSGAVLVTGGGLALETDAMAAAAANWGMATLGVAKAAQRKLVHIMHTSLAADGVYVAEVTVMGGVSGAAAAHAQSGRAHMPVPGKRGCVEQWSSNISTTAAGSSV